jgi:hypothetical protein
MRIAIREQLTIKRPAWEVREQFRDITHHVATGVHPQVRMAVVDRRAGRCRYVLTTRFGPVRVHHDVVLDVADDGILVNELRAGPLRGARLSFRFDWVGPDETVVAAAFDAPLRGAMRFLAPAIRRHAARLLTRMLDEDRADLEATRYERFGRRALHPSLT